MKNIRGASLRSFLILAALCLCAVGATAQAQRRDARFISAKAGGVNYVSGKVAFRRAGETRWVALSTNDDLKTGDALKTGDNGRAEVLLNPGSYLRLGGNSEVELVDSSLDDLRVGLKSGSAVVEATGYRDMDLSIVVQTPHTSAVIVRSGIYRFDVLAGGVTEISVQKGRALIGPQEVAYKGGKVVRVGAGGEVEVAKYQKRERDFDELDLWSKERGGELAKMNQRLSQRHANSLLASTSLDMFPSRFSTHGVWYYNSRFGCYTFVPFGGSYWSSPYGHGYGNQLYLPYGGSCFNCGRNDGGVAYGNDRVRNRGGNTHSNSNPSNGGGNTGNNPYGGGAPSSGNNGGSSPQPVVTGTPSQPMMVIQGRGRPDQ